MRRLLLFLLPLCLSVWGNAQTTTDTMPIASLKDWARLTDTTYTLRFPKNWTVDQSGIFGSRFFLFSPLDSINDSFRENFNLIINEMDANRVVTLEYLADGARQQVESMIPGVQFQEFKIVHEGDDKYYRLEYSGKQGKFDLHWKQLYFFVNHRFYVLTFTAEEAQYSRYLPVAERIFSSFVFK